MINNSNRGSAGYRSTPVTVLRRSKSSASLAQPQRFDDIRRIHFDGQFGKLEFRGGRDVGQTPSPADYRADFRESFAHQFGRCQVEPQVRPSQPRVRSACAQSSTPFFQMKKKPARISTTNVSISRKREHLQLLVNHGPRIQENRFDIEQDEQHRHQIEFNAEALPRVAGGAMPHSYGISFTLFFTLRPITNDSVTSAAAITIARMVCTRTGNQTSTRVVGM